MPGNEVEYLDRFFQRTPGLLAMMQEDGSWLAYREAFLQPGAVAAALNDYRATFQIDVPRYRAEQAAGKRVTTPTLVLWGENGNLASRPVREIWRAVADDVRGAEIADCGHYLPEEQPAIVQEHLLAFARACFDAP